MHITEYWGWNIDPRTRQKVKVGSGGTGTCILADGGQAWILTCKHVCPKPGEITVLFADGRSYSGTWLAADSRTDLALIQIAASGVPVAPIASRHPVAGDQVIQAGYPGGNRRAQAGVVVGYQQGTPRGWQDGTRVFLPGLSADSGDSGSGVILKTENALVGVIWAKTGEQAPYGPAAAEAVEWKDIKIFVDVAMPPRARFLLPWRRK
ncbi:MAG TPA: serine protease, partial [Chloroflexia bacterium]|nr:serine protease [Chloroflexia bacterium]